MLGPHPTKFESKAVFMQRCQASRSVLGASREQVLDAMEHAAMDGPTLLTGLAPSPDGLRQSYCERLWEEQQRKFRAEALLQGVPEEEAVGGGTSVVYVSGVYASGIYE